MRSRAGAARRRVHENDGPRRRKPTDAPSPPESWPEVHGGSTGCPSDTGAGGAVLFWKGSPPRRLRRLGCFRNCAVPIVAGKGAACSASCTYVASCRRASCPPHDRRRRHRLPFLRLLVLAATVRASLIFSETTLVGGQFVINNRCQPRKRSGLRHDDDENEDSCRHRAGVRSHIGCIAYLRSPSCMARPGLGKTASASSQEATSSRRHRCSSRSPQAAQRAFEMTAKDLSSGHDDGH